MAKKRAVRVGTTKRPATKRETPAAGKGQDGTAAPVAAISLLDLTDRGLAALRERVGPRSPIARGAERLQTAYERLLKR